MEWGFFWLDSNWKIVLICDLHCSIRPWHRIWTFFQLQFCYIFNVAIFTQGKKKTHNQLVAFRLKKLKASACLFDWYVEHFDFLVTITFPYRFDHCSQPVEAKILTYTEVINSKHRVRTLKSLSPEPDFTPTSQKVSPEHNSIPISQKRATMFLFMSQ